MRRLVLGIALFGTASALGAATPITPPVVEYRIDVRLDAAKKTLTGREHLLWRNPSGDQIAELRFHLYLNAFRNNRTTFMRESGGQLRGDRAGKKEEDWGFVDIRSMKTDEGTDLRSGFSFAHPDSPDPEDRTVLGVRLPEPVPPHGRIGLTIDFEAKLPKVFARTGFVRDFFLAGQWFPKIGLYEPAGMRHRQIGGWNCHQFHAHSEFYADYGSYDVTIHVPKRFIVGATGVLVGSDSKGDETAYHYRQDNVHDFAWTADPRYHVHEFRFDPARDIPPGWQEEIARELGKTPAEIALRPVAVRILMQPDHENQWKRYRDSVCVALSYYGLHYGAYPYPTLTIVDPPEDGQGAGGMEYPTFITAGTNTLLSRWPFRHVRLPEVVTIHEFGHQYWYGMVGSNEFEESWMDEGINSYSEERAVDKAYDWREIELPGRLALSDLSTDRAAYVFFDELDPIVRTAWGYYSGNSYGVNSYMKPALILRQMEADLGTPLFQRCLRAYFDAWSYRHPDTHDFFDVFEKISGRDLSVYRDGAFFGTKAFDLMVASASTRRSSEDQGIFDRGGKRVILPEKTKGKTATKQKLPRQYLSTVVVGRAGAMPHGGTIVLRFEDGATIRRELPSNARWVRYQFLYKSKLASAAVDPKLADVWDVDLLDNSRRLETDTAAVNKLTFKIDYVVARVLQILWALA
jgi:Peptidase family M1 domain